VSEDWSSDKLKDFEKEYWKLKVLREFDIYIPIVERTNYS